VGLSAQRLSATAANGVEGYFFPVCLGLSEINIGGRGLGIEWKARIDDRIPCGRMSSLAKGL
jgi:hypothetical protein